MVSCRRRRCHQTINKSNIPLSLTDEQNQQRPEARIERRLDRDDLSDDKTRVPLELAPPHRAKRKEGVAKRRTRAIDAPSLDDLIAEPLLFLFISLRTRGAFLLSLSCQVLDRKATGGSSAVFGSK